MEAGMTQEKKTVYIKFFFRRGGKFCKKIDGYCSTEIG